MARKGRDPGPDGIAVVDKEPGWTSHDVVAKARGVIGTRKVGHSGTLDPDATGVLVLGVGKGTRLLRFLQVLPKTYEASITFGANTSTLDASGEVTETFDMSGLTDDRVREHALRFVGDIEQIPPMVSAVKVGGRRLHELAREGIEVERAPRPVTVYRFEVSETEDPMTYRAIVECSSGTYVRTLAEDLGTSLGGGGHLSHLRRTSVGGFGEEEATSVDKIVLLPLTEAMRGFPSASVDDATEASIRVGGVLEESEVGVDGAGPWAMYGTDGSLLAVYERFRGSTIKPAVVLAG